MSVTLRELGLTYSLGYNIADLFDGVNYGVVLPDKRFKVRRGARALFFHLSDTELGYSS